MTRFTSRRSATNGLITSSAPAVQPTKAEGVEPYAGFVAIKQQTHREGSKAFEMHGAMSLTLVASKAETSFTCKNPLDLLRRLEMASEETGAPVNTHAVDVRFKDEPNAALALIEGRWGPKLAYVIPTDQYRALTGRKAGIGLSARRWTE